MFSKLLAKTCILPDIIVGPFRFTRKLSATVPDSYHDQFMLLAAGMVSTGIICRFNMPLSNCFRIPLHIVQRMKFHWRRYLHSAKLDTHQSLVTVKLCPAFLPPTKQLPEMKRDSLEGTRLEILQFVVSPSTRRHFETLLCPAMASPRFVRFHVV